MQWDLFRLLEPRTPTLCRMSMLLLVPRYKDKHQGASPSQDETTHNSHAFRCSMYLQLTSTINHKPDTPYRLNS